MVPLVAFLTSCSMLRARPPGEEAWQPREVVVGRSGVALPKAPSAVSATALEAVRAYAAERDTRALIVMSNGHIALEWYAEGTRPDAPVNGDGMTRTVIALLFGILQGQGRLPALDRPVHELFSEWERDAIRSLITWRDLLEMTSGLAEQSLDRGLVERTTLSTPDAHTPGFTFNESDVDTQLLALAIERTTGQRLATVLSDRLWRPIGAADAALWLDKKEGMAHASCCLFATPRDWARIGQLLLDGGRIDATAVVPRDFVVRMSMPSRRNPDYGWHVWRLDDGPGSVRRAERSEPVRDTTMFWLEGEDVQRVYVMPASGLVVVRLGGPPADWDDAFVVNTLIRGTGI